MTTQECLNLALERHRAGNLAEAEALYRQVLAQTPNHPDALNLLGVLAGQAGHHQVAIELISRAITLCPQTAEFHLHMGVSLDELGRYDQAVAAYRNALALRPDYAAAAGNLGKTLSTMVNQATVLGAQGHTALAIAALRRILDLAPPLAEAHWNLGLMLLKSGDFQLGWPEYEWRSRVKAFAAGASAMQPQWDDAELGGRRILLSAEQGLGDAIQFIRYVPLVARRGGKVIVACDKSLHGLFGQMREIDQLVSLDEPPPAHDVQSRLMSLPLIFKTSLETIPGMSPYLQADRELMNKWRSRLGADGRRKVGLVWAGGCRHQDDRNRSLSLLELAPLAAAANQHFFSLQKGEAAGQVQSGAKSSPLELTDFSDDLHDFSDTAALMGNLDLVITADTAVAHLAGALGKAVWVLLPFVADWRWMVDRSDSPWYPTMRLFRQASPGDWASAVNEVLNRL